MLSAADAALVIGDRALFVDHRALGADKLDLGEIWTTMTGLPFVWAFWAGPPGAAPPETVGLLQRAAEEGMAHTREVAADYCRDQPALAPVADRYLRENLAFRLTPRALEGLGTYYAEAGRLGLAPRAPAPAFFEGEPLKMKTDGDRPHR
jgi:chorismate dehydratase